jgi:Na+/glutamate symporter
LKKRIAEGENLPLPAAILLLTTIMLFTTAATELKVIWLYVPAFFHGVQYLVVTTSVRLKQSGADLSRGGRSVVLLLFEDSNLRYWGSLLGIAACLYLLVPLICTVFGVNFQVAFASVFVAVSLHHFLADSAIWKIRDPQVRKLLI